MKNLVVYSSVTGNTKKIARAIGKALPECIISAVEENVSPEDYDNVFLA